MVGKLTRKNGKVVPVVESRAADGKSKTRTHVRADGSTVITREDDEDHTAQVKFIKCTTCRGMVRLSTWNAMGASNIRFCTCKTGEENLVIVERTVINDGL